MNEAPLYVAGLHLIAVREVLARNSLMVALSAVCSITPVPARLAFRLASATRGHPTLGAIPTSSRKSAFVWRAVARRDTVLAG